MNNVQFRYIPVENLYLDRDNPRLPKSLRESNPSEKDIVNFMLREASTIELMLSIKSNGFFPGEQLLIVETGGNNYTVVEGNRRLTAVKLLHNSNLADIKQKTISQIKEESGLDTPTELPCFIFHSREEILKHIGFKHITGIKSWRLLERARYVYAQKQSYYSDKSC